MSEYKKTSEYMGVSFYKRDQLWKAQASLPKGHFLNNTQGRVNKHIGTYETEKEASFAYRKFIRENDIHPYIVQGISPIYTHMIFDIADRLDCTEYEAVRVCIQSFYEEMKDRCKCKKIIKS